MTAQEKVDGAVGELCWRAERGYGSFLTFDLGGREPGPRRDRGEWHLWVYAGDWTLLGPEGVLATEQDDQAVIERAITPFGGKRLTSAVVDPLSLEASFAFEGDLSVEIGPTTDDELLDMDWWLLFTPAERVLVVGPGPTWTYRSSHEP